MLAFVVGYSEYVSDEFTCRYSDQRTDTSA